MEGKDVIVSGLMLDSPRWDSDWQGGSGRTKRKRERRRGAGEAKRVMAALGFPTRHQREGRDEAEDDGSRPRTASRAEGGATSSPNRRREKERNN